MKIHMLAVLTAVLCFFGGEAQAFEADDVHNGLVIIFDASGSMNDPMSDNDSTPKINVAKDAVNSVIPQVPENTYVGMVVFDSRGVRWVYELGELDQEAFLIAVNRIQADQGTPLGTAMKRGADALMGLRESQHNYGSYQLLVVTDGEASGTGEVARMNRNAPEIAARGIRLDVIGVAMKGGSGHSLAQFAHSYKPANDSVELASALSDAINVESGVNGGAIDDDALSGISYDVAQAVLDAVNAPRPNHGIGERAPAPPAVTNTGGSGPSPVSSGGGSPPAQSTGCSQTGDLSLETTGGLLAAFLGLMAVLVTRLRSTPHRRVASVRTRR